MYHIVPENDKGQFEHADRASRKDVAIRLARSLAREMALDVYVFPGDNEGPNFSVDYIFKAEKP